MLDFLTIAAFLGLAMLIWDCIEVGRNDAANLVNAVFGARVMNRRVAVAVAGVAVVLGATFGEAVVETARKGIFDVEDPLLTVKMALAIYISVYFVDTVLLYAFSGFGMPVSTTAMLVFELVGAALFLKIARAFAAAFADAPLWEAIRSSISRGSEIIQWDKVGQVAGGIVVSIFVSGLAAFMVMRVFRAAIRDRATSRETVMLHGPWISGAIFTWLSWFMIFKGLKKVELIKQIKEATFDEYGVVLVILMLWGACTLLVHLALVATNRFGYKYLFSVTAIVGMICMAFAFGQNDLANAASPGLSGFALWSHGGPADGPAALGSTKEIPMIALFLCGVLMASGMFTQYAQRVTRAEVNTGSQFDHVALYAPRWCKWLARNLLFLRPDYKSLAPRPSVTEAGKKVHYDTLRASVITGVSASVIAFASSRGLPVSTTYVAFAAVLGSGFGDRVFNRGDADLKVGRAIWVISCWFIAPMIALVATGCVAVTVFHLGIAGLAVCLVLNLVVRFVCRRRADAHEKKYHLGVAAKETDEQPGAAGEGAAAVDPTPGKEDGEKS